MNKAWNSKLSNCFNNVWLEKCLSILPINILNQTNTINFEELNYKNVFFEIYRKSKLLEKGSLFRNWSVGPAEINAIGLFEDILVTGFIYHILYFFIFNCSFNNYSNTCS